MTHDPIAYIYEADHHCPACTEERFGRGPDGQWIAEDAEDNEGNPVGALFSWDEWAQGTGECETLSCSDCGEEIDIAHVDPHSEGCADYEAPDVWALCEAPPKGCEAVADLYHWSTNYDAGKGPFTLLLDLLGWSQEELGAPLYDLAEPSLGYVELDKLSLALREYVESPETVRAFVSALIEAERR